MKISAWQKASFIDYPGNASTVIFTSGCNLNCGYCHNPELKTAGGKISEKEIFDYIDYINNGRKLIDGVVISGGEPTLQPDLLDFIVKIKDRGLAVKLDTNGSNPDVLKMLLKQQTIDYLAMDIKGPLNLYDKITGAEVNLKDIKKSIRIASKFPDYEFRTTITPVYENEKPRWMMPEEIEQIAKLIYDWTAIRENNWTEIKEPKYFLQKFIARDKAEMLDERFAKENLPGEMQETPKKVLEDCMDKALRYLPYTNIR